MTARSSSLFVCVKHLKEAVKMLFFFLWFAGCAFRCVNHSVFQVVFHLWGSYFPPASAEPEGRCWCSHAEAENLHMVIHWGLLSCLCSADFQMKGSSSPASPLGCASFNKRTKIVMCRPLSLWWQKPLISGNTTGARFHLNGCVLQWWNLQFSSACRIILMALMWWRNFGKLVALCKWSGTYWHLTALPVCSAPTVYPWSNILITIFRGQRGHRHWNWSKPLPEAAVCVGIPQRRIVMAKCCIKFEI